MIALIGLLSLLTLILIVSRVGSVSLEATGMARDSAAFQARSALLGVGFTTSEAEDITSHPVRRRIVLYLMTAGNASVITGAGSFILAFVGAETTTTLRRSAVLILGILALLAAFHTRVANKFIRGATRYLLNRYTTVDARDYAALLRVQDAFEITELHARQGGWMVGRPLAELHLTKEGVVVLGVHRTNGTFLGAPTGETVIQPDDYVVAYGRVEVLTDLANRPMAGGDATHEYRVGEHQRLIQDD